MHDEIIRETIITHTFYGSKTKHATHALYAYVAVIRLSTWEKCEKGCKADIARHVALENVSYLV